MERRPAQHADAVLVHHVLAPDDLQQRRLGEGWAEGCVKGRTPYRAANTKAPLPPLPPADQGRGSASDQCLIKLVVD